ncbi:MAG: transcription antitermination factor NusB [Coriobacteriales bacterium]
MARNNADRSLKRTRAREQALQLLFTRDFINDEDTPLRFVDVMDDIVVEEYAHELYEGVIDRRPAIDEAIESASENWSLSRMALTDRSILRIAVFELMFRPDIPAGVSINEAVELAQRFGGEDDSYRFVNGVLGKVATQLGDDAAGAEGEADDGRPADEAGQAGEEEEIG